MFNLTNVDIDGKKPKHKENRVKLPSATKKSRNHSVSDHVRDRNKS